jgi:hypothetical protein
MDLNREQQQKVMEISPEEEEKKTETSLSSNEIMGVCKMWETVQKCVEKHDSSKAVAVRARNLFKDMQCHISVKSPKGGKSKCHWIGSLLKSHKKNKSQQIAVIPLATMKDVLSNN